MPVTILTRTLLSHSIYELPPFLALTLIPLPSYLKQFLYSLLNSYEYSCSLFVMERCNILLFSILSCITVRYFILLKIIPDGKLSGNFLSLFLRNLFCWYYSILCWYTVSFTLCSFHNCLSYHLFSYSNYYRFEAVIS